MVVVLMRGLPAKSYVSVLFVLFPALMQTEPGCKLKSPVVIVFVTVDKSMGVTNLG